MKFVWLLQSVNFEQIYSRKRGTISSLKNYFKSVHATEYEAFLKLEIEKQTTVQPSKSGQDPKTNYSPRRFNTESKMV